MNTLRSLILTFLFLFSGMVYSQNRLAESDTYSDIYIYRISSKEVQKLYKCSYVHDEFLHSPIAKYKNKDKIPDLPNGNYLKVQASGNQLLCTPYTVDDLQYKIIKGPDVLLYLFNRRGEPVTNAEVLSGSRTIKYNPSLQAYEIGKRISKTIEINHEGICHFVETDSYHLTFFHRCWNKIKQCWLHLGRLFARHSDEEYYNQHYSGFLVTSKPIYKPGETVKMKAYCVTNHGRPLNRKVALVLNRSEGEDTLLSVLKPYRPGAFTYEFKITDNLKLDLDRYYALALKPLHCKKNEHYLLESFKYEEYELKKITFSVRSNKNRYSKGEPISLFLKATDENGSATFDGQVQLVITQKVNVSYSGNYAFVPDTIYSQNIELQDAGEKEIVLPDSIFPPNVSSYYNVHCTYLNSENEKQEKNLSLYYDANDYLLNFSATPNGLQIKQLKDGRSVPSEATVTAYDEKGTELSGDSVSLPVTIVPRNDVVYYNVKTEKANSTYFLREFEKNLISYKFYKEKNQLKLITDNPCKYPFWYIISDGSNILVRGYTNNLSTTLPVRRNRNYYLQINYLFGGQIRTLNDQIISYKKQINIDVHTPENIYPGMNTSVKIQLTDRNGRPVKNADVTAYAITSRFQNQMPFVPCFETIKPEKNIFFSDRKYQFSQIGKRLDWNRWRSELNLNNIEYYKFLYPDPVYSYTVSSPSNITQLSPYVVVNGRILQTQILWIDSQPYYFSQSQQFNVYSFPVSPGRHSLKIRTFDREILADSIDVQKGSKTILSIDGEKSNPSCRIQVNLCQKRNIGVLTDSEIKTLGEYLLLVKNNFGSVGLTLNKDQKIENQAWLDTGDRIYRLNRPEYFHHKELVIPRNQSVLIGPFPESPQLKFYLNNNLINTFNFEGGYAYTIQKGYLKLKSINQQYLSKNLDNGDLFPEFGSYCLTREDLNNDRADLMNNVLQNTYFRPDFFRNGQVAVSDPATRKCKLQITLKKSKNNKANQEPLLLFFFNDKENSFLVYPGKTERVNNLFEGTSRVVVLLRDKSYYEETIDIKSKGMNFLCLDSTKIRSSELFSKWVTNFIQEKLLASFEVPCSLKSYSQETKELSLSNGISGIVLDSEDESPLPGVSIRIKGTSVYAVTDINGRFSLVTNNQLSGTIECSFIGYEPKKLHYSNGLTYTILLKENKQNLNEVFVLGYGTMKRSLVKAPLSVMTTNLSDALSGSLSGLAVESIANKRTATIPPMIILNGVPYSGKLEDIDTQSILFFKKIDTEKAVALYGNEARGGVLVITTRQPEKAENENGQQIRQNFHDDAFWQPALKTDKNGCASFNVTYPDDITQWNARFLAMGAHKKSGLVEMPIHSFKAVEARLSVPAFAIEGDSLNVRGKLINLLNDTISVKQTIAVGNQIQEKQTTFTTSHIDNIPVVAPSDSLTIKYLLHKSDGYTDGELHTFPVFKQGISETYGVFRLLNKDTLQKFSFDPRMGKISIYAEKSGVDLLLRELKQISDYPYLCNEQAASKLKALLEEKKITNAMNRPFHKESQINYLITYLNKNRNEENLWGWWSKSKTEFWISRHVIEAMLMAEANGYKTNLPKQSIIEQLILQLNQLTTQPVNKRDWYLRLLLLKELNTTTNYSGYISRVKDLKDTTLTTKFLEMTLQQQTGTAPDINALISCSSKTMKGELYWEEKNKIFPFHYSPSENNITATLLAYQLLKRQGNHERELEEIRNFLFGLYQNGSWRNTYESSEIIETILPDILETGQLDKETVLTVNGIRISKFPYSGEVSGPNVEIVKSGSSSCPVYFTAYQKYQNKMPEAIQQGFVIKTTFRANNHDITDLEAGKSVDLVVSTETQSDAEYVMIEVPIPSGCSYEDKKTYYGDGKMYREYFKEKVSIFCNRLSKGKHQFTIRLLPRYTGRCTLNPAKAELMYFPTFYGRECMKKVMIH